MSESMNAHAARNDFHWQLLTTVSSLALLGFVYGANKAQAADDDTDRPTVWIELGGQLERVDGGQVPLALAATANMPKTFLSPSLLQRPPLHSVGEQGKISFEPEGSDWVFAASVRYGRSNDNHHSYQKSPNAKIPVNNTYIARFFGPSFYPTHHLRYANTAAANSEDHLIVDFQAGKDLGLGMFGGTGKSIANLGVRFAQFNAKSNVDIRMLPDLHYRTAPIVSATGLRQFEFYSPIRFHDYHAVGNQERSFRGIGPSISWDASVPFVGAPEMAEISVDWGVNAAILFGRQKASGYHRTVTQYHSAYGWQEAHFSTVQSTQSANHNRARTVIVPNVGGFAGLSFRYANAKLSFGYRGDFFFGAMDGGIDTAKKENVGFYGPFATVSIGLGG